MSCRLKLATNSLCCCSNVLKVWYKNEKLRLNVKIQWLQYCMFTINNLTSVMLYITANHFLFFLFISVRNESKLVLCNPSQQTMNWGTKDWPFHLAGMTQPYTAGCVSTPGHLCWIWLQVRSSRLNSAEMLGVIRCSENPLFKCGVKVFFKWNYSF